MSRLASLALLPILGFSVSGCFPFIVGDGGVHAEGTVVDSAGRPVADALVYFDKPVRQDYPVLFERRTGADGHFYLSPTVAPGRYYIPLMVQAPGYQDASIPIPTLKRNTVAVELEREDSQSRSQIRIVVSK